MGENRGYYRKYDVKRVDGRTDHDGCDYFTIDLTHDQHARAAMLAYADSCEAELPELAKALRELFA